MREKKYIVERHAQNPILTGADFPNDIITVFNGSVVKQGPNKYIMVCRCEDSGLARYLWACDSTDGINFVPRPSPMELPMEDKIFKKYCRGYNPSTTIDRNATLTYLDPRVTEVDGQYYIVISAHTHFECLLALLKADRNMENIELVELISPPDNRNGVLFPEKIDGYYWRMERPNTSGNGSGDIWVQRSPDLEHWGHARCVARVGDTGWAYTKLGPGAPPIRTKKGWLSIIHGVRLQCTGYVYGLGAMLLDLDKPSELVGISKRCILGCQEPYEQMGQTPNVVFTTGTVVEDDDILRIYYGACDSVMCLATANISELVESCITE